MSDILDVAKKDGRWTECPSCSEIIITTRLEEELWVCPHCGFHFRINARQRMEMICDPDGFSEIALDSGRGDNSGIIAARAGISSMDCIVGVMDFANKGGSMGVAMAGAIITLMRHAQKAALPFLVFCASGGVRVQEGTSGLFQMIRTVHARNTMMDVPMITVFTDPTMGGVTASFAGLADVMIAEPGARIGFAGPRVIGSIIGDSLPSDFQGASRLLEKGFLDAVVHRHNLKNTLAYILEWFNAPLR